MKKVLLFTIIFFLSSLNIFSQAEKEINYQALKLLMKNGNLDKALSIIEELLKDNQGDATLSLYQAEIWFEKGENYYRQKKFKSSFIEYQKVYKVWQNNALVKQRYLELQNKKPLVDEATINIAPLAMIGRKQESDSEGNESEDLSFETKLMKQLLRIEMSIYILIFTFAFTNFYLITQNSKNKGSKS